MRVRVCTATTYTAAVSLFRPVALCRAVRCVNCVLLSINQSFNIFREWYSAQYDLRHLLIAILRGAARHYNLLQSNLSLAVKI